MKRLIVFVLILFGIKSYAQIANTGVMDTTDFRYQGKVTVSAYIDAYYAYDFNKPVSGDRPYFVSMPRHNEITINLAFIDIKYSSSRLRGRFVPGFGTYINANYAAEGGSLKNIVEASAGIKLFKNKNIWMDAGVFGSPYTNESAISKDHLAYTRSFAPEYVPYYLSGLKLTLPLSNKIIGYFYLLNGWQQIGDPNKGKSLGTQLEYRPSDNWLINWNTYVGSEESPTVPENRTRYFSDVFFIYAKGDFSATGCVYYGLQKRDELNNATWWQANLIGQYSILKNTSVTTRIEYFEDPESVQITPITNVEGFSCYSASVGLNFRLAENFMIRTEYRSFYSTQEVFERNGSAVKNSNLLTSNVTIWF